MNKSLHDALLTARWSYPKLHTATLLVNAVRASYSGLNDHDLAMVLTGLTDDQLAQIVTDYASKPKTNAVA